MTSLTLPGRHLLLHRAHHRLSNPGNKLGVRLFSRTRALQASVQVVRPSEAEVRAKQLDDRNLEAAVRGVHQDGVVVVEGVIPDAHLDHLNARMIADARALQARVGPDRPFNYNPGNIQLDPPPWAEYFAPEIFTNPIATQVTSSVLGPRPRWTFCSANAALPASTERQPVHSDAGFAHPDHPFALVLNVPLVDMTPLNGATELWPGTHRGRAIDVHGALPGGRILPEALKAWQQQQQQQGQGSSSVEEGLGVPNVERKGGPSLDGGGRPTDDQAAAACVQAPVKKGSIVIRDLRLWHAGMPNRAPDPGAVRVMLAMIHFAGWYRTSLRLGLADDVRPLLDGLEARGELGLNVGAVDWLARERAEATYLDRGSGHGYSFEQEP